MKKLLVLLLCLFIATPASAQGNQFKVRYKGGTVQTTVDADDWGNRLTITPNEILLVLKDGQQLKIEPQSVTALSYGREAKRRVGLWVTLGILVHPLALFGLFHKGKQHFIGVEYATANEQRSGILLQGKSDHYRAILTALKGATGKEVETEKKVPSE